ncbi:MAG: HEAT repeat domain-containing protein [Fischerella sp.]|nr:HEAT repeat domain-containing protein [Fischerella sp.]
MTKDTRMPYLNIIVFQIAIAFVCFSSPLLLIHATWAKPLNETQINSYIQKLKNPQQRSAAIDYLATVGKPAVPALIKALQDSDAQVRASAAIIIGKIGPAAAQSAPVLLRTIGDKDATVRAYAVEAIKKIGRRAYVPYLIAGLDSKNAWERYSTAHALRGMGKDAAYAVPALMKKLDDKDAWMRVNVVSALANIGQPSVPAIPGLIARLQDTDETVRHTAAYALGNIGLSLQENLNQVSKKELDIAVSGLETALKVLQNPSLKFNQQEITFVSNPLSVLKKEMLRRKKSAIVHF